MDLLQLPANFVPVNATTTPTGTFLGNESVFVSDGQYVDGRETIYEVLEEFPPFGGGGGLPAKPQFVQVVEPPTVVNYLAGPNGTLIPVLDNTLTLLSADTSLYEEPLVPSHILDHMYAKKRKDPGAVKPPRAKRQRRKEPAAPVPPPKTTPSTRISNVLELGGPNTTKVNIIRKGTLATPQSSQFQQPLFSSRPKILQTFKNFSSHPSKAPLNRLLENRASPGPTPSVPVQKSPEGCQNSEEPEKTPEIYFIPPSTLPQSSNQKNLTHVARRSPNIVIATTSRCSRDSSDPFELPGNVEALSKTDSSVEGATVATFRLNSDGSISPCGSTTEEEPPPDQVHSEKYSGLVYSLIEDEEDAQGGGDPSQQSIHLCDKQFFYLYE